MWNNAGAQKADSVLSLNTWIIYLPADALQHERLTAAINDPLWVFFFFSREMINCKIAVTFLSLISWFTGPRCAPDFTLHRVRFVMETQLVVMWGLVNGTWNQYASDAVDMKMIHKQPVELIVDCVEVEVEVMFESF